MYLHGAKLLLAAAIAFAALPAMADLALARSRNCMSCHTIEKKVVGPAFRDAATKYRGDKGAQMRLTSKIMEGGGGNWGVVKMPANPHITEAEAKRLAAWILSQ